jgi:hypothetical protein
MSSELQRVVDALGASLERSVALDDTGMRLQVHSAHYGVVDEARTTSLLERRAPAPAVAWVLAQGIATAAGPVRLPAHPDLGLLARVCVPVRCQDLLLGYLWLIDPDEQAPLPDASLAAAAEAAEQLGVLLYREQLLHELERGRERELLRDLLADEPVARAHAAQELRDTGLFRGRGPVVSVAVRVVPADRRTPRARRAEGLDVLLGSALDALRGHLPPGHLLSLVRPDHGLAVLAPPLGAPGLGALAQRLHDAVVRGLAREGQEWRVLVGTGDPQPELEQAVASYRHAIEATGVAEVVTTYGPVVDWTTLGIYRTLARLPAEDLSPEAVHPGLAALLAAEGPLLETLECYLDRAGDAQRTSAALGIHRTSLYYRLTRIEELTGADLREGDDRLALHLGLKMARLAGMHRSRPAPTSS